MTKRHVFRLILLPAAIGLAVTALVYRYVDSSPRPAAQQTLVNVVVAKGSIPARTALTREMLSTRPVPDGFLGKGELTSFDEVVGQVTVVPLADGESVLKTNLVSGHKDTGLAYRIPPGRRAISIKVTEVSGVGGFPEPGDQVDVLATFGKDMGGIDKTRLVLENVPVLASGPRPDPRGSMKDVKPATSLTLAVTPEEALRLTLAEERGSLRVLLRPPTPEKASGEIEYTVRGFGYVGPAQPGR